MTPFRRLANQDPDAARAQLRAVFTECAGFTDAVAEKLGMTQRQLHRVLVALGMKHELHSRRMDFFRERRPRVRRRWTDAEPSQVQAAQALSPRIVEPEPQVRPAVPRVARPDDLFDD